MSETNVELLTIHSDEDAEVPFQWSAGRHRSRFFVEIRDNKKLFGIKCPSCGKVYVPPKPVCGICFVEMDEPVEVGPGGEIMTYTVLRFGFLDPATGKPKPVPYAYGEIKPDGSDTAIQSDIEYRDEANLKNGARVEVVFNENRHGTVTDIKGFRLIEA